MRLKSFYAKTMTEAMQMVRDTLGEDAIIVATREEKGGKAVRVTAAIEQYDAYEEDFVNPNFELDTVSEPAGAEDWLQYDEDSEDGEEEVAEKITDVMLRHAVPEEIIDHVVSCATVLGIEQADAALMMAIEHLFVFKPLPQKPTATACMLIGPPGAGKTLSTAKLAARAVMGGLNAAVISTDTVRAGGTEQLSAFTKLLDINLYRARNAEELKKALRRCEESGADQIFIDTGSTNPFDTEEMRGLARLITAGDIDPVLVMPAGLDPDESGEMARIYAALGIHSMLPTRLDYARRLGGLLSAAHYGGLIFADASVSASVADGLTPLSPRKMTTLLMPESAKKDTRTGKKSTRTKQTVTAG